MQIWPRNTETERSSVKHIVDMINIVMFTNETTTSRVMIGCDKLYVHIQRVKPVLHTQNTQVKLDKPSICKYGLGTLRPKGLA